MITNEGKLHIKRYLAGWVPSIGASLAYGIGASAESLNSTILDFEVGRMNINLTSYDFVNNKLVFKSSLPEDFGGKIYELGLYSNPNNDAAGSGTSRLLTTMDSATESWYDPTGGAASTFNSTSTRVGIDSLRLAPAVSATARAALDGIALDLSEFGSADRLNIAMNLSTNVANVKVLLMQDASNYYTFTYTITGSGYQILGLPISAAVLTGAPRWDSISSIQVNATATAGGAATIDFDAIRIEDADSRDPDYVLVARDVLVTPHTKEAGRIQEIEFSLNVTV